LKTIHELREEQYSYNRKVAVNEYGVNIDNWRRCPYTFLKARFYMEASAVLVWILMKTEIKPNTVTLFYGIAGIMGGILLSIPYKWTMIAALFIFFTKGILDWSDGHLARVTNQTSITGHVLDVYGALLNDMGLQIGLGFYVAFKSGNNLFYYLIPIIPFFFAAKLKTFSEIVLYEELSNEKSLNKIIQKNINIDTDQTKKVNAKADVLGTYSKYYYYLSSFLDARARSVDFICLVILVEMFTNISITWIIFILLLVKAFIIFLGGFYVTIKKDWVERSLDATINNIFNSWKRNK